MSDSDDNEQYDKKRKLNNTDEMDFKKQKMSTDLINSETSKHLYKAPTVEELNQLRETEILFNSNLFRLQTEELLKEVLIKDSRKKQIQEWFQKFQNFISNLPEHNINGGTKLKGVVKRIVNNSPLQINSDQECNLKLLKPLDIKLVGLYNVNAVVGPTFNVHVNVVMPRACFHEKDYLNARYLVKRSVYLSYLATHLATSELVAKVAYTHANGNYLHPIALVTPANPGRVVFSVFATPEDNSFKMGRLQADKNNIRAGYFNAIADLDGAGSMPTPFYNALVLNDLLANKVDAERQRVLAELKGGCEGLVLLIVWLRQRYLTEGSGGFTEDLMYSVVAHLAQLNKINKHMSSYQVIRHVWNFLAYSEWNCSSEETQCDVLFMDQSGYNNLATHLDVNIYLKTRSEARKALEYLDESTLNSFQALFMTNMKFHLQYDAIINISDTSSVYKSSEYDQKLNCLTFQEPVIAKRISEALKTALSTRITQIVPKFKAGVVWNIEESQNQQRQDSSISFGLEFDVSQMYRVVDKGPPAYDSLAGQFREFWGERAELRRFNDGSICEAVYWPSKCIREKRKICKQIIEFVLGMNFHLKKFNIVYEQFEAALETFRFTTPIEESNLNIINTFNELAKLLRALKLPLSIATVQGTSDAFCHTDAFPPIPLNYKSGNKVTCETETNILFRTDVILKVSPKYISPIKAIIQMVDHSKWPNDLEAVSKLRTAFYIQISEQLLQQHHLKCNPKTEYLDVLFKGLVFRFVLFHPKQIVLLKKDVDEKGVTFYKDTEESLQIEQHYDVLPKLISSFNGIHSQHPSYGPSGTLIKRWLSAQLLDETHISNVVINLINASLYLNSAPFTQPVLPQTQFIRFLHFFAHFNCTLQMVVVNFNNDLTKDQLDEIESQFQQNRPDYPELYILTAYDSKSLWTRLTPTKQILNRIRTLAKECLAIIESSVHTRQLFAIEGLFKPNLSGYNILIHLQPLLNPRRHELFPGFVDNKFANDIEFVENENDKIPVVDFDPVQLYLQDLRKHYSNFALFFHDTYGGNVIAVLWKPSVFTQHDFKISEIEGKQLVSGNQLQVNIDAIIEDFYTLGNGIVKSIDKLL